ncbi:MAG: hypothetical protein CMN34_04790 [Saprospirales bacterium]|nr:hypothetical protein [Saprospirales bacterium]|tara:strand:- start:1050 stop:1601 length:552 start_codon:yes stop_codon:yes gene_type:complete
MKTTLFTMVAAIMATLVFAQDQMALTESGKKVILKSDGTWEYLAEKKGQCTNFDVELYNLAQNRVVKGQSLAYYYNTAWSNVRSSGEDSYDAIAHFEQAIVLNPANGGLYSDLGNCYRGGFKCYEKAKYYYTKAIDNGFSKGFVYYNRAICNYEMNRLDEMRSDFEMSQRLGWNNDYYELSAK